MYSNPKTVFDTVNRAAWFIVPITGILTTYVAVTYTVTNLRGVDSPWNGGIGGVYLKEFQHCCLFLFFLQERMNLFLSV